MLNFMLARLFEPYTGSLISDLETIQDVFFHSFPTDTKPPLVLEVDFEPADGGKAKNVKAVNVTMAVAGFQQEDVKVYMDDKIICVEGDNLHRKEVPEKFRSRFRRQFPTKSCMNIEKTEVTLENGLLSIKIPIIEPEDKRKYLFGKR